MPSNQTPNYALSQWEPGDKVQRTDFNADNAKLDAALKAEADALAAHGEVLAGLSNGRVHIGSYTGMGQCGREHPTSYTFPVVPACFLVFRANGNFPMIARSGADTAVVINSSPLSLSWKGNTAYWSGTDVGGQFNNINEVYLVVAFYQT